MKQNSANQVALISNKCGQNTYSTLKIEIETATTFCGLVAFISQAMLAPLKLWLKNRAATLPAARLIVSTYLYFNSPSVFCELLKLPNVEIKVITQPALHAKGWVFDHGKTSTALVGSANLTPSALLKNIEWSVLVNQAQDSQFIAQIKAEFEQYWRTATPLSEAWLADYRRQYAKNAPKKPTAKPSANQPVVANTMQKNALVSLAQLHQTNVKKALLIAATGTGKTLLAAQDIAATNAHKTLFIAHRFEIINQAKQAFIRQLGWEKSTCGLVSGLTKQYDCPHVFATIQTLATEAGLAWLEQTHFDYVVVDEAHHITAASYQAVLAKLRYQFMLGLTATAYRSDNASPLAAFDYKIAYELSLKSALEHELVAPFHYIGLKDFTLADGTTIADKSPLKYLVAKERFAYVLTQIKYYRVDDEAVSGVIFCRRTQEAKALAQYLTNHGYLSQALSNADSIATRRAAIEALTQKRLAYLVVVDLFNEGVDVPSVNQIIFLRPTQSRVVFAQQLGRGLRKQAGKDYVLVLDLIGNYKNNFLLPAIISQSKITTKTALKNLLFAKWQLGLATINFEPIAAERILNSIDNTKIESLTALKQAFLEVKAKIGKIPLLADLAKHSSLAPTLWLKSSQFGNYAEFLQKMGEPITLSAQENAWLTWLTHEIFASMRASEGQVLAWLIQAKNGVQTNELVAKLKAAHQVVTPTTLASLQAVFEQEFLTTSAKEKYHATPIVAITAEKWQLRAAFRDALVQNETFNRLVMDGLANAAAQLLTNAPKLGVIGNFARFVQYSRRDVCRLLEWQKDVSAPMYGYREHNGICPIFITYHPEKNAKSSRYHNKFFDRNRILWFSKTPRTLASAEINRLLAGVDEGNQQVKFPIFVKPNDASGSEFYYLGLGTIEKDSIKQTTLPAANGKAKPVVCWQFALEHELTEQQFCQVTTQSQTIT